VTIKAGKIGRTAGTSRKLASPQEPKRKTLVRQGCGDAAIQSFLTLIRAVTGGGNIATSDAPDTIGHFRGYVYAVAHAIASGIARTEFLVEQRRIEKGLEAWVPVPSPEIMNLLDRPNPDETGIELLYASSLEMSLFPVVYWFFARSGKDNHGGEIREIHRLAPQGMEPVIKDGRTTGYRRAISKAAPMIYGLDEIMPLRVPAPRGTGLGAPPMSAAGPAIRLLEMILRRQLADFESPGMDGIIAYADEDDPVKRDALLAVIKKLYRGPEGAMAPAVFQKDRVLIDRPPHSPVDMGYGPAIDAHRDGIQSSFRTPSMLIGLSKDVTRANAEGSEYVWAKWLLEPLLEIICARITQHIIIPQFGLDLRLSFKSPVPADRITQATVLSQLVAANIMTPNDARAELGLAPQPWGAGIYVMPLNIFIPDGEAMDSTGESDGENDQGQQKALSAGTPTRLTPGGYDKKARRVALVHVHSARAGYRPKVRKWFKRYFIRVGESVAAAVVGKAEQSARFDMTQEEAQEILRRVGMELEAGAAAVKLAKDVKSLMGQGIILGGDVEKALGGWDVVWGAQLPEVAKYLSLLDERHWKTVTQATQEQLGQVVVDGLASGKTIGEIAAQVQETAGGMADTRSALIADTESTKATSMGQQAFRDAYQIAYKQWACSFVNSRDSHMAADGQVVPNAGNFQVGSDNMQYPGEGDLAEENCNCHCVAIAIGDPGA